MYNDLIYKKKIVATILTITTNTMVNFCKGFLDTQPLFNCKTSDCFQGPVNALIVKNKLLCLSFVHHVTVELTW